MSSLPSPLFSIGQVSLNRWFELATHAQGVDSIVRDTLLLSFPLFCDSTKMLALAILRTESPATTAREVGATVNFLQRWIQVAPDDFSSNGALLGDVQGYLDELLMWSVENKAPIENLKFQMSLLARNPASASTSTAAGTTSPAIPEASSTPGRDASLLAWSPKEIADQLTALNAKELAALSLREFLCQQWDKSDSDRCPNVRKIINGWNQLGAWIQTVVVKTEDTKERGKVIGKLIKTACYCNKLRNYGALMAILSSLLSTPVGRLKKAWALTSPKRRREFEELSQVFSFEHNYQRYRSRLQEAADKSVPYLPYLGVTLADITHIFENPSEKGGLLNYEKFELLARELLLHIVYPRSRSYDITSNPRFVTAFVNFQALSDDEIYSESLKREPRPDSVAPFSDPTPPRSMTKSVSELYLFPPGLPLPPSSSPSSPASPSSSSSSSASSSLSPSSSPVSSMKRSVTTDQLAFRTHH